MSRITIAILAGGRSSRMGQDKALLAVGGVPMLERIARVARQVSPELLILGRTAPAGWPGELAARWVEDQASVEKDESTIECRKGPMPALIAALEFTRGPLLLLACDMPLVTADTLQMLIAAHSAHPDALATIAMRLEHDEPFLEPALAIYSPAILPRLRYHQEHDRGAFQSLKHDAGIQGWRMPEDRLYQLLNVNDEEALAEAERHIAGDSAG